MGSSPSFVFRFPYFPVCRDLRHISLTSSAVNSGSTAESSRRPPQERNPRLTELRLKLARRLPLDETERNSSPMQPDVSFPLIFRFSGGCQTVIGALPPPAGVEKLNSVVLWPLWGFQSVSLLQPHISDSVTELAPWFHSLHDNPILTSLFWTMFFKTVCHHMTVSSLLNSPVSL